MDQNDLIKGYQKKANLVKMYYEKLESLEYERSALTKKIKTLKVKFKELVMSDPDPSQLSLFENIDVYLVDQLD